MKKIYTLCLILFISSLVFAQKSNELRQEKKNALSEISSHSIYADRYKAKYSTNASPEFRSASSAQYQLDSILYYYPSGADWELGDMEEYAYTAGFNSQIIYSYFDLGKKNPFTKVVFDADLGGKVAAERDSDYDELVGEYYPTQRYAFNSEGKKTEYVAMDWDDVNQLSTDYFKNEYIRTGSHLDADNAYRWDTTAKSWNFEYTYTYLGDENGNDTLSIYHRIPNYEILYDTMLTRKQFILNTTGLDSIVRYSRWTSDTRVWSSYQRDSILYDTIAHTMTQYQLNEYAGKVDTALYRYEYDDNYNLTTYKHTYTVNGVWHKNEYFLFSYDTNVELVNLVLPNYSYGVNDDGLYSVFNENYVNKRVQITVYYGSGDLWEESMRDVYYYSTPTVTSVTSKELPILNLYPNPATNFVSYQFDAHNRAYQLSVYDLNGNLCLSQSVHSGMRVDVSNLPKGMYSFKLMGNGAQRVDKVIIK